MLRSATPLDPSGAEGRSLLRRELLEPRYHEDPLGTLLAWIERRLAQGLDVAAGAPAISTVVAMVLLVLLVLALGLLASRARSTARVRAASREVLATGTTGARELRDHAERLLTEGRPAEALLESFRALARRQVEQGRLRDDPGATAREVAADLRRVLGGEAGEATAVRLADAAENFDAVLYGGLTATPDQVRAVLALDDELGTVRR